MPHVWSREMRSELKELAEKGKSSEEIAVIMKRSPRTIRRVLSSLGISRPNGRPSKMSRLDIRQYFDKVNILKTMSIDDAAATLGVTVKTLRRKFKEFKYEHPIYSNGAAARSAGSRERFRRKRR